MIPLPLGELTKDHTLGIPKHKTEQTSASKVNVPTQLFSSLLVQARPWISVWFGAGNTKTNFGCQCESVQEGIAASGAFQGTPAESDPPLFVGSCQVVGSIAMVASSISSPFSRMCACRCTEFNICGKLPDSLVLVGLILVGNFLQFLRGALLRMTSRFARHNAHVAIADFLQTVILLVVSRSVKPPAPDFGEVVSVGY